MDIKKKICVENYYSGSDWNFEKTTKYIFEMNGRELEAGYFEHFRDGVFVKAVIELPQSYGCAAKCLFCASASIPQFEILQAEAMEEMFDCLYEENHLSEKEYVLLTMTGTGDLFFNYDNVERFLLRAGKRKNIHVTLSSCLWNEELLGKVRCLGREVNIRNVQITYVTDEKETLSSIIPFYHKHNYDFRKLISTIEKFEETYYRINYIVIKGVNDSKEDMEKLCRYLMKARQKVTVRIARLNETGTTRKNHLQPTEIAALEELQVILQKAEIKGYVYYAQKNDNMNCGQLITEKWGI